MKHIIFNKSDSYNTAILIKTSALNKNEILNNYINPIKLDQSNVVALSLKYENNKCTIKQAKEYLEELLPILNDLGVRNLYVCDGTYFKALTKVGKIEPHYGYTLESKLKGYEGFKVILSSNYQSLIFNPSIQDKIDLSLTALSNSINHTNKQLGDGAIHSEYYPNSISEIREALDKLMQHEVLAIDVETNSLNFWEAGLETIAFAWDKHNALAFCIDRDNHKIKSNVIRDLIKQFFKEYKGTCIYHNGSYDIKVLVYELWMNNLLDYKGKLEGIEILTKDIEDTKIITYLATNSTAGNKLDLKSNSHEFLGNYGVF